MPPKSITFVSNHGEVAGGEQMLLRMAPVAAARGAEVRVVAPMEPPDMAHACSMLGLEVIPTSGGSRASRYAETGRVIRRLNAELTWCNGLYPALAALGAGGPRVVHLHQRPTPFQAPFAALARRAAACTVVPSHSMARALPGSRVLWNWTSEPSDRTSTSAADGTLRVGFVGRLSPIKGLDVLARAAQLLLAEDPESVRLLVAGDSRFVPRRKQRRVRRALAPISQQCDLLGWVPAEQVYSGASVVAVPSVCEAFGLVAAEAMSHDVPLVVSDAGALPEIVGQAHPWMARRGDADDLARVLRELRSSPQQLEASVRAAHGRWERLFSRQAGEERFAALLDDLDRLPPRVAARGSRL